MVSIKEAVRLLGNFAELSVEQVDLTICCAGVSSARQCLMVAISLCGARFQLLAVLLGVRPRYPPQVSLLLQLE